MNRELTNFGTSVNHAEDVKYKVSINNKQLRSYLDCNDIVGIEALNNSDSGGRMISSCQDCGHQSMTMINGQLEEIFRSNLMGQIIEGLSWNIAQLLYNQHFSNPVSLYDNPNRVWTRITVNYEYIDLASSC